MNESDANKSAAVSDPPPTVNQEDAPMRGKRKRLVPVVILVLVVIAGFFIWRKFIAPPAIPENIVQLSGRIEGDDSAIAPKTSGRILEIGFREGDEVKAGDVIARLDDQKVRASAKAQVSVLEEQLLQNQLQTEQAQVDSDGRVRQAEADLAAAEADLAQQQAAYQIALFDKDAYTRLAKTGAVSERQGKQSQSTANQQAAAVAAAQKHVDAATGSLTTARANLSNPSIRRAAVAAVRRQIAQQQAEIASATAKAEQAKFQLEEASANRQDLTVTAPFDGTVITRAAEPGEVVTAGTAIVTLLDLKKVYLRGFVPEGQIGKVKIGQAARVYLDSHPDRAIDAYVLRIDPQATFTPENTYFRDDRVKQVVGVKLQLKGAIGFAKPGMPADGEVLVQGDTWTGRRTK
jgi:HlyD family secretion protein